MPPKKDHTGNLEEMVMYGGMGVPKIKDVPSAAELIHRLWSEFENKE